MSPRLTAMEFSKPNYTEGAMIFIYEPRPPLVLLVPLPDTNGHVQQLDMQALLLILSRETSALEAHLALRFGANSERV